MMKINRYIAQLMIICILVFNFSFDIMAAEGNTFVSENKNFRYTVITDASSSKKGTVSVKVIDDDLISAIIEGTVEDDKGNKYTVEEIASNGFSDCDDLKRVTIAETVTYIGNKAFYDCSDLKKIVINSSYIQIGRSAFEGIDEEAEFYVVSRKVKEELLDYGIDEDMINLDSSNTDDEDDEEDTYRLKVMAGEGGTVTGTGYYKKGDRVTIKAYPKTGYEFASWQIVTGKAKIADANSEKTTLKMTAETVKIKATFVYVGEGNLPSQFEIDKFDTIYVTPIYGNNLNGTDKYVNLGENGIITASNFSTVVGMQSKLVAQGSNYRWVIEGKKINTDILEKSYINLGVEFFKQRNWEIGYLTEYKNIILFDVAGEGKLPFEGSLEFYLPEGSDYISVYLYKYDEEAQKITYCDFSEVDRADNNKVSLKVSESGTYVVTSEIIKNSDVNVVFENNKNLYSILPYYLENGETKAIIKSAVVGDTLNFKASKTTFYGYVDNSQNFTDIGDSWAKAAIEFVSAREIINGSTETLFEPEIVLSKADFLDGLARIDGQSGNSAIWAKNNGIVSESGNFNVAMTRQEMATMFYRYCVYKGIELPKAEIKTSYYDDKDIPEWSRNYISVMSQKGIAIGKKNGKFEPYAYATKAEASVSFKRLIEIIVLGNN